MLETLVFTWRILHGGATRYEHYFRVVKLKELFSTRENNIRIFQLPVMFLLLSGLKSEQANREHRNPAGKHTRFSRVIFSYLNY